jgi:hypothetical protein
MKKVIKKEKMVAPKKTTKTKKNEPILDLTMAEDDIDVFAAYGRMKVEQGKPILKEELDAIIANHIDAILATMFTWNNTVMLKEDGSYVALNLSVYKPEKTIKQVKVKKPGMFKRFWNWITRKK